MSTIAFDSKRFLGKAFEAYKNQGCLEKAISMFEKIPKSGVIAVLYHSNVVEEGVDGPFDVKNKVPCFDGITAAALIVEILNQVAPEAVVHTIPVTHQNKDRWARTLPAGTTVICADIFLSEPTKDEEVGKGELVLRHWKESGIDEVFLIDHHPLKMDKFPSMDADNVCLPVGTPLGISGLLIWVLSEIRRDQLEIDLLMKYLALISLSDMWNIDPAWGSQPEADPRDVVDAFKHIFKQKEEIHPSTFLEELSQITATEVMTLIEEMWKERWETWEAFKAVPKGMMTVEGKECIVVLPPLNCQHVMRCAEKVLAGKGLEGYHLIFLNPPKLQPKDGVLRLEVGAQVRYYGDGTKANCTLVAKAFGGGGHASASGFTDYTKFATAFSGGEIPLLPKEDQVRMLFPWEVEDVADEGGLVAGSSV